MTESIEPALRQRFDAVANDLTAPADRLGEVARRVRRRRRRRNGVIAGAAVAVAAVLLLPLAFGGGTGHPDPVAAASPSAIPPVPADKNGCPTKTPLTKPIDAPGPLAPAGATAVVWCERLVAGLPNTVHTPPLWRLTTGVADLLAALNGTLTESDYRAAARAQALAAGFDPDHVGYDYCTLIGFVSDISLVVQYADDPPVVIWIDRNCGEVFTTTHTRHTDRDSILDRFKSLYRSQIARHTDPASITMPACPASLTVEDVRRDTIDHEPLDGIGVLRGTDEPLAPLPLVAVRACRYPLASGAGAGPAQIEVRDDLTAVRDVLNRATTVQVTTDSNGMETVINLTDCGQANGPPPLLVDAVYVADQTGSVTEVRVIRQACGAVIRAGFGALLPTPELTTLLDGWLGPIN